MQLDIFNDSRDVMLRNDLWQALQKRDVANAQAAWLALQQGYPDDPVLASAHLLLDALQAHALQVSAPAMFADHAALRQERLVLLAHVTPAAQHVLGQAAADHWLRRFWQHLVARAALLPFAAEHEAEHAAPILLHLQDRQGVVDVVTRIESWHQPNRASTARLSRPCACG